MPIREIPERDRLNFSWLITLRWSSIAGQLATIFAVYWLFAIDLPLLPLLLLIALQLVSNIGAALWARTTDQVFEWHVAAVMALDVLFLTGLLYFTGGPFNPFSFLYLVNIALAAVALHAYWTWTLVGLSLLSFGALFIDFRELPFRHMEPGDQAGILQQGMWVAFGVAAGFIVHFLLRVTGALAQREAELGDAQRAAARQERLASLATMAAGAAHELSTPLGTIALVAKELERSLKTKGAAADSIDDLRLIRDQVARCRIILDQMGAGTGKASDLSVERVTIGALLEESMTGIRSSPEVAVEMDRKIGDREIEIPVRALAQVLRSMITNAQDASDDAGVRVVAEEEEAGRVRVTVSDLGVGMSAELLRRIGEPFFTTKPPGSGMGLGVFLSRATIEKLGGELKIESKQGVGTTVEVLLPARGAVSQG